MVTTSVPSMVSSAVRGVLGVGKGLGLGLLPQLDGTEEARRNAWTSWADQAQARRQRDEAAAFVAARNSEAPRPSRLARL